MKKYEDTALAAVANEVGTSPETLIRVAVCRLLDDLHDIDVRHMDPAKIVILRAEAALTAADRNQITLMLAQHQNEHLEKALDKARENAAWIEKCINLARDHEAKARRRKVA